MGEDVMRVYFKNTADGLEDYEEFTEGAVRSGEAKEAIAHYKAVGTFLRTEG